jgi:hypothetical protein
MTHAYTNRQERSNRRTKVFEDVREARFDAVTALLDFCHSSGDVEKRAIALAQIRKLRLAVERQCSLQPDACLAKLAKRFQTQVFEPVSAGRISPHQAAKRVREVANEFNAAFRAAQAGQSLALSPSLP